MEEEPKITYHYRKSTSQQRIQIHFAFLERLYSLQMKVNRMGTRAALPPATTAATTVAAAAAVPVPPHPQRKRNSALSIAFFARSFNPESAQCVFFSFSLVLLIISSILCPPPTLCSVTTTTSPRFRFSRVPFVLHCK